MRLFTVDFYVLLQCSFLQIKFFEDPMKHSFLSSVASEDSVYIIQIDAMDVNCVVNTDMAKSFPQLLSGLGELRDHHTKLV